MEYVGLPLKVDARGHLVRSSRTEVLVAFIRVLASTPKNTWAPDPEFGLKDEFEKPWNKGLPGPAMDALNRCLTRFGWTDIKVASVARTAISEDRTVISYRVAFVTAD